jgi:hypothetical protein
VCPRVGSDPDQRGNRVGCAELRERANRGNGDLEARLRRRVEEVQQRLRHRRFAKRAKTAGGEGARVSTGTTQQFQQRRGGTAVVDTLKRVRDGPPAGHRPAAVEQRPRKRFERAQPDQREHAQLEGLGLRGRRHGLVIRRHGLDRRASGVLSDHRADRGGTGRRAYLRQRFRRAPAHQRRGIRE